MNDPIYKIIGSFAIGTIASVVESLKAFEGVVQTLGLPLVGICAFGYVIVKLYKTVLNVVAEKSALAETAAAAAAAAAEARLADSRSYSNQLAVHIEKGAESRAKLIELSEKSLELNAEQLVAQANMAIAVEKLSEAIKSRHCQK